MDTPEKPKRPWWRKKRWWAVGLLWLSLPAIYAVSVGPAYYAVVRGWLREGDHERAYRPLHRACASSPTLDAAVVGWELWWIELGERHEGIY